MAKYLNINDAARGFMTETFDDVSSQPYSSELATTMRQICTLYEEAMTEEQKASLPAVTDYNALADVFYRLMKAMSISGGGSGGGGEDPYFVANCSVDTTYPETPRLVLDKTGQEIADAYQAGKTLLIKDWTGAESNEFNTYVVMRFDYSEEPYGEAGLLNAYAPLYNNSASRDIDVIRFWIPSDGSLSDYPIQTPDH